MSKRFTSHGINPIAINDRLMKVRIQLKSGEHFTIVSVYAPPRPPEEKEQFYEKLGECLDSAKDDHIIVLGDLSGRDLKSWPIVIGKHGVAKMNSNGLMILEFCTRFKLSVICSNSRTH